MTLMFLSTILFHGASKRRLPTQPSAGSSANFVAFTGSSNESRNAFENNRECIDVFSSWESFSRADRKRKDFEDLWNRRDLGVNVYDFSEVAKLKLIQICEEEQARDTKSPATVQ